MGREALLISVSPRQNFLNPPPVPEIPTVTLTAPRFAFGHAGLDWQQYVKLDPALVRPAEVDHLIGDATKARERFGWAPTVDFRGLVTMMVDADLARLSA